MTIRFNTDDGIELSGELLLADNAKAVVLINPATATKTNYYRPFAEFLVEHGYHVMLWNYRGFCDSKTQPLNQCHYRYSDIGCFDIPAAINFVTDRFPDLPLLLIGHSAGGQQIGFTESCHKAAGLVALGVSAGHFDAMPLMYRLKALFFFKLMVPIAGALCGYVPAARFGFMEDLPLAFAKEWGDWCS